MEIWLTAALIVLAVVAVVAWRPKCPACGSRDVARDAIRTWSGGIYQGVLDYRCQNCGHEWEAN